MHLDISQQKDAALFAHAGTFCPQPPAIFHFKEINKNRPDPSSCNRVVKYPVPAFFKYRMTTKEHETAMR